MAPFLRGRNDPLFCAYSQAHGFSGFFFVTHGFSDRKLISTISAWRRKTQNGKITHFGPKWNAGGFCSLWALVHINESMNESGTPTLPATLKVFVTSLLLKTWMRMEAKAPPIPTLKNLFLLTSYKLTFYPFHSTSHSLSRTLFLNATNTLPHHLYPPPTSFVETTQHNIGLKHKDGSSKMDSSIDHQHHGNDFGDCCQCTISSEAIGEDSEGEEAVWQRVGMQRVVCLLLQWDHLWFLRDIPVWEPVLKAQCTSGTCCRLLGLPLFHHCCSTLPASWVWHHWRKDGWDEGGCCFFWPCGQQDLL